MSKNLLSLSKESYNNPILIATQCPSKMPTYSKNTLLTSIFLTYKISTQKKNPAASHHPSIRPKITINVNVPQRTSPATCWTTPYSCVRKRTKAMHLTRNSNIIIKKENKFKDTRRQVCKWRSDKSLKGHGHLQTLASDGMRTVLFYIFILRGRFSFLISLFDCYSPNSLRH